MAQLDMQQLVQATHHTEDELRDMADLLLILHLYEEGTLSSAEAAMQLDITRGAFQALCADHGIAIDDPMMDPLKESQF